MPIYIISIIVTVLLLLGVFLLSEISFGNIKKNFISARNFSVQTVKDAQVKKKPSLRKQVEMVTGSQKVNFLAQNFGEARLIMQNSGRISKYKQLVILSVVFGAVGVLISFLLKNIFLLPTLSVGFALLPSWYIKITENFIKKHLNAELEVALSTVTTSYIRNDSLVLSAEENLKYLNAPLKQVFTKFVNENKMINSNVIYGIQKMKLSIDSSIFHEWCDAMIHCQSDRTLKVTLLPIVSRFSELKSIQEELDTLLMMPIRDFMMVSIISIGSIPMLKMLNDTWFRAVVDTTPGKIILSIVSLCFFYGLNKAINLSKPIEMRR